jgi:TonB family protein
MRPPPPDSSRDDFALKRGVRLSLFVHGLLLVWVILSQVIDIGGKRAEEEAALRRARELRTAIRVDVVGMPMMKPEDLAQVDPTLEVSKDPGTPPEAVKVEPSQDAMVAPRAEPSKPDPKAKKTTEKREEEDPRSRMRDVRERLRADSRRKELLAKLEGDGKRVGSGGRQVLAGNQLSEGYSVTGDIAKDGDVYTGKVKAHLHRNWFLPAWMTSSNLKAHVVLRIAPDGRVVSKEFAKRSGNADFDAAVEKTINAANPLPPPPEALRRAYLEDGLGYSFP